MGREKLKESRRHDRALRERRFDWPARCSHRSRARQLQEALGKFIEGYPWTYWVTLTFRNRKTTRAGARALLLRWIEEELPPRLAPARLVFVIELQREGTAHVHALWLAPSSPSPEQWKVLKERWFCRHGIARFFPYDPARSARFYLAKYLVASRRTCWDIYERGVSDGREGDDV